MLVDNSETEFTRMLGELERDEFQAEVCAFLRRCITDFQDVPAKPQGDGGLDGLSHGQSVGYCCYGPDASSKARANVLKASILKKFRADLRTIFEVESKGQGKKKALAHCATVELKTILARGKKIKTVRLIVSVFETHQLLGPLNEAFDEYKAASQCQYVDQAAGITLWGPKELATAGIVDDLVISRLEQRETLRRVAAALASGAAPAVPTVSDFDAKFDWIAQQAKTPAEAVERMRAHFRKRWSSGIALENDLANNAVVLHQALSRAREEAAIDADLVSGTVTNPTALVQEMRQRLGQRLDEQLGVKFPPEIRTLLVDGELARLIGECPIEWRN